jgi:hypothetical protein
MIKSSELSIHEKAERNFKYILLGKRRQSDKTTYCMISLIQHSRAGQIVEMAHRSIVAKD